MHFTKADTKATIIPVAGKHSALGAVRWWLFKGWVIRWRVTGWCAGGPHVAG